MGRHRMRNRQVTMHISGLALNLDKGTFTIDVDLRVNVSSYKNAKGSGGVNILRPAAPFLCMIPASRTHGKPIPMMAALCQS